MPPTQTRYDRRFVNAMAELRRLLLVRLDGLGDAVVCVPALEGLRDAWPGMRFGAVCSEANARLFSQDVSWIHIFDPKMSFHEFMVEIRAKQYTDAMIATEEPVGYRIARFSGASRRAGFWHRLEKSFKSIWQRFQVTHAIYRPAAWRKKQEHEAETIYRLATALGAALPVPRDPRRLSHWLNTKNGSPQASPQAAFGFQVSRKLMTAGWGPAGWTRFLLKMMQASSFDRCVMLASRLDEALALSLFDRLAQDSRSANRVSLALCADLPGWLARLASLGALITADTGAAHAAGMLGVPVIDFFEPLRFTQLSHQWRPWAAPSHCIVKPQWRAGADETLAAELGPMLSRFREEAGPRDLTSASTDG